ncbi:MAG TPA: alanine dehydrogenase [Candidatus Binataceae bacterium]|jgi:alanine dehydrogenase|nr:alanine dehydrogenase [Candidatus Binataceae bacterium]
MIVGVPTEIKPDERRVALTPAGAAVLRSHGHRVLVQSGAGAGSGHSDREYQAAGAQIVRAAAAVWARARMVLKVKEPQPSEFRFLRPDLVLFTYLHLAAEPRLARELVRRGTTALGYETVQLADGSLPLLAPMSEVAGRLAIQVGGWCLEAQNGGDGVLLSGAAGVRPGRVAVLGGGIAGANAARVAAGVGAEVTILDVNPTRLRYLSETLEGRITTVMSNRATIEEEVLRSDLVVGTVLVPGARTPRLITRRMVSRMKRGAALVDLSIDQGGLSETSRPTSHKRPIFIAEGVVHYCVTNMPAIVPHTSTYALTNATLSYALELADHGVLEAGARNAAIRAGLNTFGGHVAHPAVAAALRMKPRSPWD